MENITLSPDQKRLLAEMRDINYGSIKNFEVRDGVPILPEHLEISKEMFCDLRHRNKPDWNDETHASMPEVADLFADFAADSNMQIHRLRFAGGLPTEVDYVLLNDAQASQGSDPVEEVI